MPRLATYKKARTQLRSLLLLMPQGLFVDAPEERAHLKLPGWKIVCRAGVHVALDPPALGYEAQERVVPGPEASNP